MRPGTLERINFYRERADAGLPIFQGTPTNEDGEDAIPILRKEGPHKMELGNNNQPMTLDRAIQVLTQQGADEKLDAKIQDLQAEIDKLKKIRKLLNASRSTERKTKRVRVDSDDSPNDSFLSKEQDIVEYIEEHGSATAADIGRAIGVSHLSVGFTVAKSERLRKNGKTIELA